MGIFLSVTYFIVIPVIPEKNESVIVIAIKIPNLLLLFVLIVLARKVPSDRLASNPKKVRIKTYNKLSP